MNDGRRDFSISGMALWVREIFLYPRANLLRICVKHSVVSIIKENWAEEKKAEEYGERRRMERREKEDGNGRGTKWKMEREGR